MNVAITVLWGLFFIVCGVPHDIVPCDGQRLRTWLCLFGGFPPRYTLSYFKLFVAFVGGLPPGHVLLM